MIRPKTSYRGAVAIVYMCMFFEGGSNMLLSSTKEQLMGHFGISLVQLSLLFTIRSVAGGLIPFLTGGLSDKLGRKKIILLGTLFFMLYYLAVPNLKTFVPLIIMIAVYGLGYSFMDPSAQSILFDNYPNPTPYMPFVQVAFATGSIIVPLVVSWTMRSGTPWQLVYYAFFVLAAGLAVFTVTRKFPAVAGRRKLSAEKGEREKPAYRGHYNFKKEPKPLREGLAACLMVLFTNMGTSTIANWADVYMREVFAYSEASAVQVLSYYQMGCVAGALLASIFARRLPPLKLISVGTAGGFVLYISAAFMPTSGLFIAAVVGSALFTGSLFSITVGYVGQLFWKNAGASVGAVSSSSAIGIAMSSLITGSLTTVAGIRTVFYVMSVSMAIGVAAFIFLRYRHKQLLAGDDG